MEKRAMIAIFMGFLILSASPSPMPAMINETFQNSTSNVTIQHNNRFVFFLAPAISALASALGYAAAGTAAVLGAGLAGHAIHEAVQSGGGSFGGSSGGSSGGSPGGSPSGPSAATRYGDLVSKATPVFTQIQQQLAFGTVSLTVLKVFDFCNFDSACTGVNLDLFGPKMYMGILVEKGQCPKFRTDEYGHVVAAVLNSKVNLLTADALFQFPPSGICNKECCMLKKNLLPGLVCFEKKSLREGTCMAQCSTDKMELDDSMGCENGQKCCGHYQTLLLG